MLKLWTKVKRNKFLFDEINNIARQVLKQFKEFSLTKQKTRPEKNMNVLEKPFRKKTIKKWKNSKNKSQLAACEHHSWQIARK